MSDEFLPPGSLLWSESWPYWMPNTLLGMLPPLALPRVPGDQFGGHGLQQSFSANGEAASPPNDPAGGNAPAWLDPAISSRASGGILRFLTQSDGLLNQSPSAWAQSAMPFRASAGILAPLTRANDHREQSPPAWLQLVSRWSHEPSAAMWDSSTLATPSTRAPVLPSAPQRAADSALIQTLAPIPTLDEVLSDADPQELVPGARYAQNLPRRGATGPSGRELSPPESIRLLLHSNAHRTLRDLDPKNPQLESLSSPTWVPTQRDINRLHEEIAKVLRKQSVCEFEVHHTLPRQFSPRFNGVGIDIEDYKTYLPRDRHRLLPNGLHTGSENWNAQWKRFFEQKRVPTQKQILELLSEMLKKGSW
jgi:hypothetical protein